MYLGLIGAAGEKFVLFSFCVFFASAAAIPSISKLILVSIASDSAPFIACCIILVCVCRMLGVVVTCLDSLLFLDSKYGFLDVLMSLQRESEHGGGEIEEG